MNLIEWTATDIDGDTIVIFPAANGAGWVVRVDNCVEVRSGAYLTVQAATDLHKWLDHKLGLRYPEQLAVALEDVKAATRECARLSEVEDQLTAERETLIERARRAEQERDREYARAGEMSRRLEHAVTGLRLAADRLAEYRRKHSGVPVSAALYVNGLSDMVWQTIYDPSAVVRRNLMHRDGEPIESVAAWRARAVLARLAGAGVSPTPQTAEWIRQAIGDPTGIVSRAPGDDIRDAESSVSLTARAVLAVLADAGIVSTGQSLHLGDGLPCARCDGPCDVEPATPEHAGWHQFRPGGLDRDGVAQDFFTP